MKDNFSRQSELYARYRPTYPDELFDFILQQLPEKNIAWDCATGNGQTATELAKHFKKVLATDISARQIGKAQLAPNIEYSVQPAEKTDFDKDTFDLVTVSQALHWLQFDLFYAELRRVAKPGSWIAAWMYALLRISPAIDELIHHHHYVTLKAYWDEERRYVDDLYQTIPFPFEEISCPLFHIRYEWTLGDLEGYLNTWSALQKFISSNNYNPVDALIAEIQPHWAPDKMSIDFPVYLRMGKIIK